MELKVHHMLADAQYQAFDSTPQSMIHAHVHEDRPPAEESQGWVGQTGVEGGAREGWAVCVQRPCSLVAVWSSRVCVCGPPGP